MLAEGLIHLHFMSPYTLFRNNSQTQQGLTVPAKIYTPRFQCGKYNMLVLLGESKGNERICYFILRKQLPKYTGCGLSSLFRAIGDSKGKGDIVPSCTGVLPPPPCDLPPLSCSFPCVDLSF